MINRVRKTDHYMKKQIAKRSDIMFKSFKTFNIMFKSEF